MNPTKSILVSAAIAGLVAGAAVKAQADHHEEKKGGEGAKVGAEQTAKSAAGAAAAPAPAKGKTAAKASNGCSGPNGCGGEKGCGTPEAKPADAKAKGK